MFRILRCTLQSPWYFVISLFLQIECELCFLFTFVLFVYNLYCYYLVVKKKSAIKEKKKEQGRSDGIDFVQPEK